MIIYRFFSSDLIVPSRQKYNHALLKIDNEVYKRLSKGSECFENDARTKLIVSLLFNKCL